MRTTMILAAAVASAVMAVPASALVVSQSGVMTASGQNFSFNFSGLLPSNGTGAVLTISSGPATTGSAADDGFDIDGVGNGGASEYMAVSAEGVDLGTYSCGGAIGTSIPGFAMNGPADCIFSLDIALDGASFDSLIADGVFGLLVDFSAGVGDFGDGDQLNVALSYTEVAPVPLPAAGLMLMGGLAGLGALSRRRKTRV